MLLRRNRRRLQRRFYKQGGSDSRRLAKHVAATHAHAQPHHLERGASVPIISPRSNACVVHNVGHDAAPAHVWRPGDLNGVLPSCHIIISIHLVRRRSRQAGSVLGARGLGRRGARDDGGQPQVGLAHRAVHLRAVQVQPVLVHGACSSALMR